MMKHMLKEVWILARKTAWLIVMEHKANKCAKLYSRYEAQCRAVFRLSDRYRERFNCDFSPKGE